MSPDALKDAAVLGGNRIPFARRDREYAHASNQDMLTAALDGLAGRFGLQGVRMGQVAAGGVLKRSRDFNLTRESVLGSALAPETPAYDVQQACGTGLETTIHVANKIALGQIECGVAGGYDTTSDAPIEGSDHLRRLLLAPRRAGEGGRRPAPPAARPESSGVGGGQAQAARAPPAGTAGPQPAAQRGAAH